MGRVAIYVSAAAAPTLLWWFVALDFSSPWADGFSRLFWFISTVYCFAAAYWLVQINAGISKVDNHAKRDNFT